MKPIRWLISIVLLSLTLTACGGVAAPEEAAQAPPAATATNTALPTTEPPPAPTATELPPPSPTATLVVVATTAVEPTPTDPPAPATEPPSPAENADAGPVDWLASVGRTEDGLMYLGNPDAPVTLTDYSDFM
jgi:hypothetical protein